MKLITNPISSQVFVYFKISQIKTFISDKYLLYTFLEVSSDLPKLWKWAKADEFHDTNNYFPTIQCKNDRLASKTLKANQCSAFKVGSAVKNYRN